MATAWGGLWCHLPPHLAASAARGLSPALGRHPVWLGICEVLLEDKGDSDIHLNALEVLATKGPSGFFAHFDPTSVAAVMCRLAPPTPLPTWSAGLVEAITETLSPYQARGYHGLAEWVPAEQVEPMTFAAPATWALWMVEIRKRLSLSPGTLVWLWSVTQGWQDEVFLAGLLRQVTHQPYPTLRRFLHHLDRTLEPIGGAWELAGKALLDLEQYHSMLPKTHLLSWDELAQGVEELIEPARGCPVRAAALEAWLEYLADRSNCCDAVRRRLQDRLSQILPATGRG
jgi:hypothetical protein